MHRQKDISFEHNAGFALDPGCSSDHHKDEKVSLKKRRLNSQTV